MLRPADAEKGQWTKLRFSAGTGIKPPTAFEIAFTDNPDLKPERNRSWDAGIEQGLMKGRLVADVTWFSNRYNDLIVTVGSQFAGASKFRTDNIANARARGLELGVTWRGHAGLSARGAWTRLDTEVLDLDSLPGKAPSPFHVGDPLLRCPRNQGSLSVGWTHARAGAFVEINGRGDFLDTEPNFGTFGGLFTGPGYTTVTIGASVRAIQHVEIFGRVSNLLDREYEEALGFPALGRAASIGVRIATGR
jgi:outer membrane receptor protein involved in Fe transport